MITGLKNIIVFLLIIAPATFAAGQENYFSKPNQVKISPFRLVDLVNPGIELSYERRHGKKYSSQFSMGFMRDFFKVSSFDKYKGIRMAFEEKYFFKETKTSRYYGAAEVVFLKANFRYVSSFDKDTTAITPQYTDSFSVAKKTFAINLKGGIQIPVKRFILDISAGLGVKYKRISRDGLQDIQAYEITPIDPNAYYMAGKEGNYFIVNVPVNIRIGYRF